MKAKDKMVNYKVITEAEWQAAAPKKPASKRTNHGKTVCLRDENGTKYYGRRSDVK